MHHSSFHDFSQVNTVFIQQDYAHSLSITIRLLSNNFEHSLIGL